MSIFLLFSNDFRKFKKVISTFPVFEERFTHIKTELVGELYSAEKNINELHLEIGI